MTVGHLAWRGLLLAAALQLPAQAQEACTVKALTLPVTMVGQRAIATVGINGTPVPLVVDSGAFYSFLTEAAAQQLQLRLKRLPGDLRIWGLTGSVDARMTTVKQLQLAQGSVPNVDFVVGGNEPGAGSMGLLGRNVLAYTDIEYDLANGAIRLMFPSPACEGRRMAYWAGDKPVIELDLLDDPRSRALPAIKARARLNGTEVDVLFDTGATSIVSLKAARRAGVAEQAMTPTRPVLGAGRGEAKAWTAAIEAFEIGGEKILNNRLRIADFDTSDFDMLLGIDYFLSHRLYVSKDQRRAYITYSGGPVFALNSGVAPEAAALAPTAPPPTDAAGFVRRGAALAARGDYERALADLDRAAELAPQTAEPFVRRGLVHLALKRQPQALQDFETALRLDPDQREARLQRAALRAARDERDGALDDLQALDRSLPPQAQLRRAMARLFVRLGRPDLALPQWNHWIPSHRNEATLDRVLNERCFVRAQLGIELDQALDDCDEAIDQRPKEPAYLDSRGWVRLRRGEWRRALADYDAALTIRPDLAWSLYGRGLARLRLGDTAQGQADIEQARRLMPSVDAEAARWGLAADAVPAPR